MCYLSVDHSFKGFIQVNLELCRSLLNNHFWFILQNHLWIFLLRHDTTIFFKSSISVIFTLVCNRQGYVISSSSMRQNLFIDTKSLNHCETLYMYEEIVWRVGQALYTKHDFTMILKDLIYHYEGYLKILSVLSHRL